MVLFDFATCGFFVASNLFMNQWLLQNEIQETFNEFDNDLPLQNYEIKGWALSDKLYKAIIASVIIHSLALITVSQIDLFGTKACDSPYINKVCQVLETVYTASSLLGTDTEFSSRDYEKTEIPEEPQEVTFVDVSDQFNYPPGYFDLVRQYDPNYSLNLSSSEFSSDSDTNNLPTFNDPSSQLDLLKPQTLPTPNPNPVIGNLPAPYNVDKPKTDPKFPKWRRFPNRMLSSNDSIADKNINANVPIANLSTNQNPIANSNQNNNQPINTNPIANNSNTSAQTEQQKLFNKKPLEDFGIKYGQAILNKEIDLNAPFEIEIKATLNEFGKFAKSSMVVKPGSDPKMVEVAKEAISAFSDSQLLLTLYNAGVRNVTIKFSQDKDNLQAIIISEAETPNKASAIQSSVNFAIKGALLNMNPESDEAKLINKAELSTQGKLFIVNFLLPNNEKVELIEKNLRSLQEKLKKSNSEIPETLGKEIVK